MLKLAVEAQLPLVAVTTRDTMNLNEILKEITKKTAIPWTPVAASAKGQLYMHVHDEKMKLPLTKLYEQMVKFGSTLVLVEHARHMSSRPRCSMLARCRFPAP